MIFMRIEAVGYDGIFSHSVAAVDVYSSGQKIIDINQTVFTLIKSTGLAVFPFFLVLLPLGIFGFFKNRSLDKFVILFFLIFMSLTVIYVSIREISEPRYFLTLFPIFSLFSIYTVNEIMKKINKTKLITTVFIIAVLLSSIVYLDYTKIDY